MSNFTRVLARTAAAAAATALVAAGGLAPALADDGDDGRDGAAQDHRASADKGDSGRQGPKQDKGGKAGQDKGSKANQGQGDERGNGHTPVTVCHLLGNGGYHVLTFDDNALEAHVNHGDIYPVPAEGCPTSSDDVQEQSFRGQPGHVRVTVCHVLGNGGYHELTFDEHALRAHEAHGDLYPVPAGGCPAETTEETPDETVPGTTQDDTPGDETDETPVVEEDTTTNEATVAGVEQFATGTAPRTGQVLGTEAVAGVNRTAPVAGPLAGVLPQTGAGRLGLAAGAGLALIGAGAALVARRRTQAV